MARSFDDYIFDLDETDISLEEQASSPECELSRAARHLRIRRAIELREDRKRLRHDLEYFVTEQS